MHSSGYSHQEINDIKHSINEKIQTYSLSQSILFSNLSHEIYHKIQWEKMLIKVINEIYQETIGISRNIVGESLITATLFMKNMKNRVYENKTTFEKDLNKLVEYLQHSNTKKILEGQVISNAKLQFQEEMKNFCQNFVSGHYISPLLNTPCKIERKLSGKQKAISNKEEIVWNALHDMKTVIDCQNAVEYFDTFVSKSESINKCKVIIDFESLSESNIVNAPQLLTSIGKSKIANLTCQEKTIRLKCVPINMAKPVYELGEKIENINTFHLDFKVQKNEISDKQLEDLSVFLKCFRSIKKLTLGFWGGVSQASLEYYKKWYNLSTTEVRLWGSDVPNDITGKGVIKLCDSIKRLKLLEDLTLGFTSNNIGTEGVKAIANTIIKLKKISTLTLDIHLNGIGEEGAKALSVALKELKNVSTLSLFLEGNDIKVEGAKAISAGLKELKNISSLSLFLGSNNIETEGAKSISTALEELKNIINLNLDLHLNKIGGEGTKSVAGALKKLINISTLTLDLGWNNIATEEAKAVFEAVKEMKNIITLSLHFWGNNIEIDGAKAVSVALRELKNIMILSLDLGRNNIEVNGAEEVAFALKELTSISSLNLNLWENNIKADGAKMLSSALKELKNIENLSLALGDNNIKSEGATAILNAMQELKNISTLNLNLKNNSIGEEEKTKLKGFKCAFPHFTIEI